MKEELEWDFEGNGCGIIGHCLIIFPEELRNPRKTSVKITDVLAEILTESPLNRGPELCRSTSQLGVRDSIK
jgi:hypothetical protein